MIFHETKLPGAFLIEPERFHDERGFFVRSWNQREWATRGLDARLVECNISFNTASGTLRGMHFQAPPYGQPKLVRCTRGAIYDVLIDLRPDSPTFTRWVGAELSAENGLMFYIPTGFAHGFQTLVDETEVFYQMSEFYVPEAGRGVRWDDPAFGIVWPEAPRRIINARDANYPDFQP